MISYHANLSNLKPYIALVHYVLCRHRENQGVPGGPITPTRLFISIFIAVLSFIYINFSEYAFLRICLTNTTHDNMAYINKFIDHISKSTLYVSLFIFAFPLYHLFTEMDHI